MEQVPCGCRSASWVGRIFRKSASHWHSKRCKAPQISRQRQLQPRQRRVLRLAALSPLPGAAGLHDQPRDGSGKALRCARELCTTGIQRALRLASLTIVASACCQRRLVGAWEISGHPWRADASIRAELSNAAYFSILPWISRFNRETQYEKVRAG
jgi:hypothetical protein